MALFTARNLTNDAIRELRDRGDVDVNTANLALCGWPMERIQARLRCAQVMNQQLRARCHARRHANHVDDVCEGTCCTTCGGPIDDNAACRCPEVK